MQTAHHVLCVPRLSYNLVSVSKATECKKTGKFARESCQVLNGGKLVAIGTKVGEL